MASSTGYGWRPVIVSVHCCWLLPAVLPNYSSYSERTFRAFLAGKRFSAYNPQAAAAKQKCLAHLERDLEALKTSRFAGNREFAAQVEQVLWASRLAHRDYQSGKLSIEAIALYRPAIESQLQAVLDNPVAGGWPADAQRLTNRIKRHWDEWFTFLTHPEVKPDNNDAERALRPIVVHRKVSGGARSDWGARISRSDV